MDLKHRASQVISGEVYWLVYQFHHSVTIWGVMDFAILSLPAQVFYCVLLWALSPVCHFPNKQVIKGEHVSLAFWRRAPQRKLWSCSCSSRWRQHHHPGCRLSHSPWCAPEENAPTNTFVETSHTNTHSGSHLYTFLRSVFKRNICS